MHVKPWVFKANLKNWRIFPMPHWAANFTEPIGKELQQGGGSAAIISLCPFVLQLKFLILDITDQRWIYTENKMMTQ